MFVIGDRIKLEHMTDDPDPVPDGSTGTVTSVHYIKYDKTWQIGVAWDNGRTLMLVCPPDRAIKIE